MNIRTLINYLEHYPKNTEIKMVVNGIEEDARCMIYDKEKGILCLADSIYSC